MDKVVVTIPYNLTVVNLKENIEEDCGHWADSLEWIATEATPEEAKRILTAAVLLTQVGHDLDVALHTATVYERG